MAISATASISASPIRTRSISATASFPAASLRVRASSETAFVQTDYQLVTEKGQLKTTGRALSGQAVEQFDFTSWDDYVPIASWTNTTLSGKFKKVGDTMSIRASVKIEVGSVVSGDLTLSLPLGVTIDSTKLPNLVEYPPVGQVVILTPTDVLFGTVGVDVNNHLIIFQNIDPTTPIAWATDDALDVYVEIPVN